MDAVRQRMRAVLNERQAPLTQLILETQAKPEPGQPEFSNDDLTQMIRGFFALIGEAMDGTSRDVRNFYFETALPSMRDAGTAAPTMISGCVATLVRIANDVVLRMPPEDRERASAWLGEFIGTYIGDMVRLWEQKPA